MEVTKIFESISEKMKMDFQISAKFNQHGNRGDYREDSLKAFLSSGKLPNNFGLASGEIISQYSQVSKQIDLIFYDKSKSIIFEASESTKIFPIESVLGTVEVKSKLSKKKLLEGLENIKSLKRLYSPQRININYGNQIKIGYYNTPPFGVIFAYALDNNSLNSLELNLKEWCRDNPPEVWPNLICILNVGIIKFQNGLDDILISSDIKSTSTTISLNYAENSLFEFTASLITMCSKREIDIFNIQQYKNTGIIIENLRVKFKDKLTDMNGERFRLTDDFIKLVYSKRGKSVPYKDLISKMMSGLNFIGDHFENREDHVYIYDPENLPSISEVINNNKEEKPLFDLLSEVPIFAGGIHLFINEETYYIPRYYINNENTTNW